MKNTILLAIVAFLFTLSVNAQSTADSIKAKYQLQPMPAALTIEKSFPAIGTYQLNEAGTASTVTITLDEQNKGMIWVEGLPEGKIKGFLKKSPSTYRILSQKTEGGKQIPEGTLIFDEATNTLSVALGMPYDDANPASVFTTLSSVSNNAAMDVKIKDDKMKVDADKIKEDKPAKSKGTSVKSKNSSGKVKTKVTMYTATKVIPESNVNTTNTAQPADSTTVQPQPAAPAQQNPNQQ